jgi:hypothetical protein
VHACDRVVFVCPLQALVHYDGDGEAMLMHRVAAKVLLGLPTPVVSAVTTTCAASCVHARGWFFSHPQGFELNHLYFHATHHPPCPPSEQDEVITPPLPRNWTHFFMIKDLSPKDMERWLEVTPATPPFLLSLRCPCLK